MFCKKNGMYYAHNDRGYTQRVLLAELYTEAHAKRYAKNHDDIRAIPIDDILTGSSEVEAYLERMNAMRDYMLSIGK